MQRRPARHEVIYFVDEINDAEYRSKTRTYEGEKLKEFLAGKKFEVTDAGCSSAEPVDYPDIAEAVAGLVSSGKCERGLLICGSGVGASVAANKFKGMRAAICPPRALSRPSRLFGRRSGRGQAIGGRWGGGSASRPFSRLARGRTCARPDGLHGHDRVRALAPSRCERGDDAPVALLRSFRKRIADADVDLIAEKIEFENHMPEILSLGIDYGQGNLFGAARPADFYLGDRTPTDRAAA